VQFKYFRPASADGFNFNQKTKPGFSPKKIMGLKPGVSFGVYAQPFAKAERK
jgi:hypothetical protein